MKHKHAFLLAVLICFHALNNYVWLKQDNESLSKDTANHVSRIIAIREKLQGHGLPREIQLEEFGRVEGVFSPGTICWPQAFHLIAAVISFGCKDVLFCIRFSNMLYFIILIIAVYLLGKKLAGPGAGLLAAFLVSFYPAVFGLSRKCGLDFPLIAAVCAAAYFLVSSDSFKNRSQSVLFGIGLGLAMLVKGQALIFILGPFIYAAVNGLIARGERKKCFLNIVFSITLAIVISMLWWGRAFVVEAPESQAYAKMASVFFLADIARQMRDYLGGVYFNLSPAFFAALLAGLALCLRKASRKALFFLACWALPPYIFFVVVLPYGNPRYILPIFGALALISAIGLMQVPGKKIRRCIIALAVCAGLAQFFLVSYRGSFEPLVFTSEFSQPPQKNNHLQVMEDFNCVIADNVRGDKNIAIVEEEYFRSDFCVRLAYFLKLLNSENNIFLSAGGIVIPHPEVTQEFIDNLSAYHILVAFSKNEDGPDLSGLSAFSGRRRKEDIRRAEDIFKSFMVVKKAMLMPEEIYIYLLILPEEWIG